MTIMTSKYPFAAVRIAATEFNGHEFDGLAFDRSYNVDEFVKVVGTTPNLQHQLQCRNRESDYGIWFIDSEPNKYGLPGDYIFLSHDHQLSFCSEQKFEDLFGRDTAFLKKIKILGSDDEKTIEQLTQTEEY